VTDVAPPGDDSETRMARPSALTLEVQYVEPDATAVSERWLRYRMPGQPPDETGRRREDVATAWWR
jgi:hypothetical protein